MGLDMTSMSISEFRITAIKVSRSLGIPPIAHQLHNGNTFQCKSKIRFDELTVSY